MSRFRYLTSSASCGRIQKQQSTIHKYHTCTHLTGVLKQNIAVSSYIEKENSGSKEKLHDDSFNNTKPEFLLPFTSGWKSGDPGKFSLRIENTGIGMQFH